MLIASGVNCLPNLALKGLAASQFGHRGLVFHFLLSWLEESGIPGLYQAGRALKEKDGV